MITWDETGEKRFKTGVDRGVLFPVDSEGTYEGTGVGWNGLTTVTESPGGAESNKQYADNGVYLNLLSQETFDGTIEAFFSPEEFDECDGTSVVDGVRIGQQTRKGFGFCYRVLVGNDVEDTDYGYEVHLVYGAKASPSEKANATVNDTPAPVTLSWGFSTTPVNVTGHKKTSHLIIPSYAVDAGALSDLEDILYGASAEPRLPMPDEVLDLFSGSATVVNLDLDANKPTFVSGTGVITLPAVTGVQWKVNGVNKASGAQPAIASGSDADVTAHPLDGYVLNGDTDFGFHRP